MGTLSDGRCRGILTRAKCLVIALTYRGVGLGCARGTHAKQTGHGPGASAAVTDSPSVSRVIHAPLKSYERYARRNHVHAPGLKNVDIEIYM